MPGSPTLPAAAPISVADRVSHLIASYRGRKGVIDTPAKTILIDEGPRAISHPVTGEVIGYEVMVRTFDATGDLGVDPHRQFINPPDGREPQDDGSVVVRADPAALIEDALARTVKL